MKKAKSNKSGFAFSGEYAKHLCDVEESLVRQAVAVVFLEISERTNNIELKMKVFKDVDVPYIHAQIKSDVDCKDGMSLIEAVKDAMRCIESVQSK